jgi:TonB family protein
MRTLPASLILLALAAAPAAGQSLAAADSSRVYELADVEEIPRPENVPELRAALEAGYPPALRDAGRQGTVVVSLVVGPDGASRDMRVLSTTDAAFDSATLAAVGVLRFAPATLEGRAVPVRVELPIQWRAPAPPAQAAAASGQTASAPRPAPEPDSVGGYELSEVEVQPRPTNVGALRAELESLYPPHLRRTNERGTVQVRFLIQANGTPSHPRITHSTHPGFDAVTLQAVRVLRFTPGRIGGEPVATWVELPIQWSP